ncbi:MAG: glyoxalase, partial [Schleiferiaceae bacterium]|nr:glyoxalase [Schleiferiaceae bacterium]
MQNETYPRSFSHIGITDPDIHKAVEFYKSVMGWYVIMSPATVTKETETAIGIMCIDVFGNDWETFEIAHMST